MSEQSPDKKRKAVNLLHRTSTGELTIQDKEKFIINQAVAENMNCEYFAKRFKAFKLNADKVDQHQRGVAEADESLLSEFDALSEDFIKEWKRVIDIELKNRAEKEGVADPEELPKRYAAEHIHKIEELGYALDDKAKERLQFAFSRFYICDIGPAPFSVAVLSEQELNETNVPVTCTEHMLQMATHFLRHPPKFMTVGELEEVVVLALFHDIYYYDDYANHGEKSVEFLKDYLVYDVPYRVIGGHLNNALDKNKIRTMDFESPEDAFRQEWVMQDWYLSLINMKHKGQIKSRAGDGVILPLDFFHHHIGRLLTKQRVIDVDPTAMSDAPPAWLITEDKL